MENLSQAQEKPWETQERLLQEAIARHPGEFGLRSFPGKTFMVSKGSSYWSELEGQPLLYTYVKDGDKWLSFAKGTETELINNKVKPPVKA